MSDINTVLPDVALRFNIEHPNLEDCYAYGYECAQAEISEDDNPFRAGTQEHYQWTEGWWAGFYEEEPLFVLDQEGPAKEAIKDAANDTEYHHEHHSFLSTFWKITGALAATAVVGYQLLDLVA